MGLLAYGQFVFSVESLAHQELERTCEWRFARNARVGARPAAQFVGPGEDAINLTGTIYPLAFGNPKSLDLLRQMADTGMAWPLVSSDGSVYGAYAITGIRERGEEMIGGKARKISFTVSLSRTDDGATDQLGPDLPAGS